MKLISPTAVTLRILAAILSVCLLCSCGYQFQGSGSILPPDIKTVGIAVAENLTTEPGLGLQFTEELRSRFDRYGAVKVIDHVEEADAVLTSKILAVKTQVLSTTGRTDVALQLQLVLAVSAELKRRNGQVLWRDPNLIVSDSFATDQGVVVTSGSDFVSGSLSSDALSSLGASEVSRGQKIETLESLVEEASRKIYMAAVAADF